MKKKLLYLLVPFLMVASLGYAQEKTLFRRDFSTWGITGNIGLTGAKTDVSDNELQFKTLSPRFVGGLTISKQFSHIFSLEGSLSTGSMGTRYKDLDFTTKFTQIDGRIRLSLVNGQVLGNLWNTQIYTFIGAGMLHYNTNVETADVKKDWVHVIPVGLGFKNKLNERTSINADLSYNAVNTDYLDGNKVVQSQNDGYVRLNVGVQYTLGKKKPLEWDRFMDYFRPRMEHEVDTVVIIQKNTNIDTLYIKFSPEFYKEMSTMSDTEMVNFDYNKWNVKSDFFNSLDDLALKMLNNQINVLVLDGYADDNGSEKNNLYVSKQRAIAIKNYLIAKGVEDYQIKINFYGSKNPISEDDSKNRRVEIYMEK